MISSFPVIPGIQQLEDGRFPTAEGDAKEFTFYILGYHAAGRKYYFMISLESNK